MRKCTRCGLDRPTEEWYTKFEWCKTCRKQYDQEYYQKNKERRMRQNRELLRSNRLWVQSQKTGPCSDCGNSYPPEIMEFDHLPENGKSFTISDTMYLKRATLALEIAKCELVCPTDHALRTLARRHRGGD